jgi:hypothetical protein
MRFSLRTLLFLLTLAAVDLAAWGVGATWGGEVTCVVAAVLLVWAVGPRWMGKEFEPPVATERWLRKFGRRKNRG